MSAIPKVKSKEREMTFLKSRTTMPVKKLAAKKFFSIMQQSVITNPIDPKRISKSTNSLTKSSLVKAGLVFLGTTGLYCLVKNTGIFSYFGWETKNSKDKGNSEIMKVKNKANILDVRRNLETARQANNPSINRIAQTYKTKDGVAEFEEIKVEKFEDLPEAKKENVIDRRSNTRRSISIKNPIPNQNTTIGKLFELTIDGNNIFNSSSSLSFEAINIPTWLMSTPLNINTPTFKGSYNTPDRAYGVNLSGNYAYVADDTEGLQIIDIRDPSNPTFKGSYDTPGWAQNVALSGNCAYVANCQSGLRIIDISDPSNPTFKGSYNTPDVAREVALSGNYAYVAAEYSGLQIIDISDPSNPTFKGSYNTPDQAYGVAVSGNYVYVADVNSGLQIIDISDPANPTFKGSYDTSDRALRVALSGNYAYVADRDSGLQIIDISDPSNPTFEGSYDTPDFAQGIVVSGNYAYVADWFSGLQIIDISDPSNPTFKGSYNTPDRALGVAVSGNYVYVADMISGLQIIALNSDKLTLLGTPNFVGTYGVDITACNEIMECITDSFDIIVKANSDTETDTITDMDTDLTTTLAIIGSSVGACIIYTVSSLCCLLIGGGIVILKQRRKEVLGGEKENKEEKELQKLDTEKDKKVVDNELSQPIE
jgi:hypothetical protein